jgi:Mn-dependent DtxR family transcriptional regulator
MSQTDKVLAFVREHRQATPEDVAKHLNIHKYDANKIMWRLADRGLIARMSWGVYTSDEDGALRRQAMLDQIAKLTLKIAKLTPA